MRPKLITVKNFAGASFSYSLSPINMVVGDNFSGKTTVEDAIRVALTGYHNRLKKTNQAMMSLAGNSLLMSVRMDLEPAGILEHTWSKNTKGEVKYVGNIPLEFKVPPVLLDPQVYFSLTSEEKVKMVFREIPISEFSWKEILGKVKEAESTGPREGVSLSDDIKTRVDSQLAMTPPMSTQVIMEGSIEYLKTNRKESKTLATNALAQVTAMQKNKPITTGKVVDYGPEIAIAQTKHNKLESEIRSIEGGVEMQARSVARKKELETLLSLNFEDVLVSKKETEAKIQALNEKIQSSVDTSASLAKIHTDQQSGRLRLFEVAHVLKEESDTISLQLHELTEAGECSNPDCPHQKTIEQVKAQANFNQAKIAEKDKANQEAIKRIDSLIAATNAELDQTQVKAKEVMRISSEIQSLSQKMVAFEGAIATRQSAIAELAGLNSLISANPDELPELRKEHQAISAGLTKLIADQSIWVAWSTWKAQSDKAEQVSVGHSKRLETIEAMLTVLQTKQEEIATEAFNGLLQNARLFTDGILLSPIEYRNGELGRVQDGAWIPHETFSGTEKLLAYAGLCVALAQKSPMKVVLMDELGVLDKANKVKLINRMLALASAGEIDLFVGADVSAQTYEEMTDSGPHINIIKL